MTSDRAEALARTITDPSARPRRSPGWPPRSPRPVTDRLPAGRRAEALARTITNPDDQARALTGLATAAAQAGDLGRAYRLAADAEALARTITDPDVQAQALTGLVTVVAQAGDQDRASQLAGRRGPGPRHHQLLLPGRGTHRAGDRSRPSG